MKSRFLNKKIWTMLVILLFVVISIPVGFIWAKYATVEDVGSFNLNVAPQEQAYAVYSASDQSLEFFYGEYPQVGETLETGKTVTAVYHDHIDAKKYSAENPPEWHDVASMVESVTFDVSFEEVAPISTSCWFRDFAKTESFDLTHLNTSEVTNMSYMFYGCKKVGTLDLSSFTTTNVTNMYCMFYYCHNLSSLNVSSFNTSKVKNMGVMFAECRKLASLDLFNFNTENVTDMRSMFYQCYSLTELNVSSFNTSKVTNMSRMFMLAGDLDGKTSLLKTLDLSNFDTSNVTTMLYMFDDCHSLQSLDVTSFNTSKVTDMLGMFRSCHDLASLDLSSFNTNRVTSMTQMFEYCGVLTTIIVSDDFVTKNASSSDMFTGCTTLIGGEGTTYNSSYINKTYARIDGANGFHGYFTAKEGTIVTYADVTVDISALGEGYTYSFTNTKQKHFFLNEDNSITLTAEEGVTLPESIVLTCGENSVTTTVTADGVVAIPAALVINGATITIRVSTE